MLLKERGRGKVKNVSRKEKKRFRSYSLFNPPQHVKVIFSR